MRVLITGGRDFLDSKFIYEKLDELNQKHKFTVLIHGGAAGVDRISGQWATSRNLDVEVYPADWQKHGKSAGPIRNAEMLKKNPDLLVAFPGGKGTADMIKKAETANLNTIKF